MLLLGPNDEVDVADADKPNASGPSEEQQAADAERKRTDEKDEPVVDEPAAKGINEAPPETDVVEDDKPAVADQQPGEPSRQAGEREPKEVAEQPNGEGEKPEQAAEAIDSAEQDFRDALANVIAMGDAWDSSAVSPHLNRMEQLLAKVDDGVVKVALEDDFEGQELDPFLWATYEEVKLQGGVVQLSNSQGLITREQIEPGADGEGVLRVTGVFEPVATEGSRGRFIVDLAGRGRMVDMGPPFGLSIRRGGRDKGRTEPRDRTGFVVYRYDLPEKVEAGVSAYHNGLGGVLEWPQEWRPVYDDGHRSRFTWLDTGRDQFLCLESLSEPGERKWVRMLGRSSDFLKRSAWNKKDGELPPPAEHCITLRVDERWMKLDDVRVEILPWPDQELEAGRQQHKPIHSKAVAPAPPDPNALEFQYSLSLLVRDEGVEDVLELPVDYAEILEDREQDLREFVDREPSFSDGFNDVEYTKKRWKATVPGKKMGVGSPNWSIRNGRMVLNGNVHFMPWVKLRSHSHAVARVAGTVILSGDNSRFSVSSKTEKYGRDGHGMGFSREGALNRVGDKETPIPRKDAPVSVRSRPVRFIYYDLGAVQFMTVFPLKHQGERRWVVRPKLVQETLSRAPGVGKTSVAFHTSGSVILDDVEVDMFHRPWQELRLNKNDDELVGPECQDMLHLLDGMDHRDVDEATFCDVLNRLEVAFAKEEGASKTRCFWENFSVPRLHRSRWMPGSRGGRDVPVELRQSGVVAGELQMGPFATVGLNREIYLADELTGILRFSGEVSLEEPASQLDVRMRQATNDFDLGFSVSRERVAGRVRNAYVPAPKHVSEQIPQQGKLRFICYDTGVKQYLAVLPVDAKAGAKLKWMTNWRGPYLYPEGVRYSLSFIPFGGSVRLDDIRIDLLPRGMEEAAAESAEDDAAAPRKEAAN